MTDIHKLTGAYAVDAVDDLERARFEQHLRECEDCRHEVAGLREAAALLAATVETAPPAGLRDSVLAGISQVRPLPPETPAPTPAPADLADPARPRRPRWTGLLLVAAALLVAVGVGLGAWQPWESRTELTAAEQVLAASDAETVAVDLGEAGRARVVLSRSEDRAVIVTEDMVDAPAGKVYELWFQTPESDMVPAGLMPEGSDQTMVLEGSAAEATAVGITVEPAGGSPEPTSAPIALFDFTASS